MRYSSWVAHEERLAHSLKATELVPALGTAVAVITNSHL